MAQKGREEVLHLGEREFREASDKHEEDADLEEDVLNLAEDEANVFRGEVIQYIQFIHGAFRN
jgi:hypothetical protein